MRYYKIEATVLSDVEIPRKKSDVFDEFADNMQSLSQTFYIKSADAAGMPSMRTFDYTERNASVKPSSSAQDAPEYVTRDELNTLTKRLEALEGRKKKGVTQDEPTV